jgi:hypothetical protein
MRQTLDRGFDPKMPKVLECKECRHVWEETPEFRKCPVNPSHGDGVVLIEDPIDSLLSIYPRRIERRRRRAIRD